MAAIQPSHIVSVKLVFLHYFKCCFSSRPSPCFYSLITLYFITCHLFLIIALLGYYCFISTITYCIFTLFTVSHPEWIIPEGQDIYSLNKHSILLSLLFASGYRAQTCQMWAIRQAKGLQGGMAEERNLLGSPNTHTTNSFSLFPYLKSKIISYWYNMLA